MEPSLGIYISVPFCRAKCTYCNFASGVFGPQRMDAYVARVCAEIQSVRHLTAQLAPPTRMPALELPEQVDSIYLGGGTPSLLSGDQVERLFAAVRCEFIVNPHAEITLECAPGQLSDETLAAMLAAGVNRVSFGVQSFVDSEAAAVGRLHTRAICLDEIARLRASGINNLNVDLIAGLPGQTRQTWRESVDVALSTQVPHISVYMLEVDDDSRLGREVLAHGARYGAADLPGEDETAEWYAQTCGWLGGAGIQQYEISNFARREHESRHNMRYWRRGPYLGFGLDAHSMLRCGVGGVRWANSHELDRYLAALPQEQPTEIPGPLNVVSPDPVQPPEPEWVGREGALEEAMFLGLRMSEGIDLDALRAEFGSESLDAVLPAVDEMEQAGLLHRIGSEIALTARGRPVSNEVFARLLLTAPA